MEKEVVSEIDQLKEEIELLEKWKSKLAKDNEMMAKVLEMYKETPLPDVFGDPCYFAEQALERIKNK